MWGKDAHRTGSSFGLASMAPPTWGEGEEGRGRRAQVNRRREEEEEEEEEEEKEEKEEKEEEAAGIDADDAICKCSSDVSSG